MTSVAETLPTHGSSGHLVPAESDATVQPPRTVIEPQPGWRLLDLHELWKYRELLFFLAWRDVKVRYKQTVLGAAWAVLQPLATMAVFALFLGPLAGTRAAGEAPYPLYVFAGLIPWTFFAATITAAGQSVVGNQNLVTKVYFPRLIIPLSSAGAPAVDLAVALALLLVMMLGYGVTPGAGALLLPAVVAALVVTGVGVGSFLAALTVAYRDFRYVVPFLVQLWMFATPIVYLRADAIGPRLRAVLPLNPAYGLVAAFRAAVLGGPIDGYALAVSGVVGGALLMGGVFYFRRVERHFSDII